MSSENKPDRSIEVRAGGTASRLVEADGCRSSDCPPGASADALNETCYCVTFDVSRLRQSLYTEYGDVFSPTIWARHEHLFATSPVFVDQHSLRRMAMVVAAVEEVVRTRTYQDAVMSSGARCGALHAGTARRVVGLRLSLG